MPAIEDRSAGADRIHTPATRETNRSQKLGQCAHELVLGRRGTALSSVG